MAYRYVDDDEELAILFKQVEAVYSTPGSVELKLEDERMLSIQLVQDSQGVFLNFILYERQ